MSRTVLLAPLPSRQFFRFRPVSSPHCGLYDLVCTFSFIVGLCTFPATPDCRRLSWCATGASPFFTSRVSFVRAPLPVPPFLERHCLFFLRDFFLSSWMGRASSSSCAKPSQIFVPRIARSPRDFRQGRHRFFFSGPVTRATPPLTYFPFAFPVFDPLSVPLEIIFSYTSFKSSLLKLWLPSPGRNSVRVQSVPSPRYFLKFPRSLEGFLLFEEGQSFHP